MKSWDSKVTRMKHKGWTFVVLDTNGYIEKVEHQINRNSFVKQEKVTNWLEKQSGNITDEWKEFIRADSCNTGTMHGTVKTHKADNPVRVKTSDCKSVVDELSMVVEKALYPLADTLNSDKKRH